MSGLDAIAARSSLPAERSILSSWRLMIACTVGSGLAAPVVVSYSIGPFVSALQAGMGWSRPQIQGAVFFGCLASGAACLAVAPMIDRFGMRRCAVLGSLGVAAGLVLASVAQSLAMFYLSYSLIALLGAGSSAILWNRALAGAIERGRGFALAIALSGTGVTGALFPLLVVTVIQHHGWRAGYLALAAVPLVIGIPVILLLFRPSQGNALSGSPGELEGVTRREALKSYRFWVLLSSVIALTLATAGIITNLIPALTDIGHTAQAASLVQGSFGIALIVGRLGVGALVDRYWAPGVAAGVLLFPVVGCLSFVARPDLVLACGSAALIGIATGAEGDFLTFLTARYFGVRHFSRIYALLYAATAISGGIAPICFAGLHDLTGSYGASFAVSAALFAIGGPILLTLGRYPQLSRLP